MAGWFRSDRRGVAPHARAVAVVLLVVNYVEPKRTCFGLFAPSHGKSLGWVFKANSIGRTGHIGDRSSPIL
jgi:hypothetical protein